jgi:hypothetical protein
LKQSLKTKLRQLWFPAAFRLPEPEFTKEQLDLLEELIQLIHPTLSQQEKTAGDERLSMAHFLVDLGTGIWRIRRKIEGLTRMPKEIKDALYSLESTWASMSEGGVEIVDHIGTIPSKNEAKVVEVRDIPNLTRDQVVETIKPTIVFRGEVIQLGEVVMGRAVKSTVSTFAPQGEPEAVHAAAETIRAGESEPAEEDGEILPAAAEPPIENEEPPTLEQTDNDYVLTDTQVESTEPIEPVEVAEITEEREEIEIPELPEPDELTDAPGETVEGPVVVPEELHEVITAQALLPLADEPDLSSTEPDEKPKKKRASHRAKAESSIASDEWTDALGEAEDEPPVVLDALIEDIAVQVVSDEPDTFPAEPDEKPKKKRASGERTDVPDEAVEEQVAVPDEKPKKKRASRRTKAESSTAPDEAPKPKRTRRTKKKEDTTEVNDVG